MGKNPGVPRAKLARAVDELFGRQDIGETRAVLVLHDGKTAAERYGEGYETKTKFLGWSMAKTVTGVMIGAQLVPRAWIEFMIAPSPRSPDYGAMTWLNRPSGGERAMLFAEQGPKDAFALVGHLGQYVIVSPSQGLTIVRLGKTDGKERPALVEALAKIAALYPSR